MTATHVRKMTAPGLQTWCGNTSWKEVPGNSIFACIDTALQAAHAQTEIVCESCMRAIYEEVTRVYVNRYLNKG